MAAALEEDCDREGWEVDLPGSAKTVDCLLGQDQITRYCRSQYRLLRISKMTMTVVTRMHHRSPMTAMVVLMMKIPTLKTREKVEEARRRTKETSV